MFRFIIYLVLFFTSFSQITLASNYQNQLITQANKLSLEKEKTWLKLLHYKKTAFGGYESQVDGSDFFLSSAGKYSPKKELQATIGQFFSQQPLDDGLKQTAQCRFLARYQWLKEQLNFDSSQLEEQDCTHYKKLMSLIQPKSLSIIYPSSDPNSPSSMFGHTLIRINRKNQTKQTRMLSFTINYAAHADSDDSFYAIRGLMGLYQGRFTVLPYYMKLREYSQMERRDLWEYDLNLTPSQVSFILKHIYEMLPTYFDYYFFNENCAYHVLSIIDVALPNSASLTDPFKVQTIPVDTLRYLQKNKLISDPQFFPSSTRKIQAQKNSLSLQERQLVLNIYHKKTELQALKTLPTHRQATLLDLLYDFQKFNRIVSDGELNPSKISPFGRKILKNRSALKLRSQPINVTPPDTNPEQGHNTSKLMLSIGTDHQNNDFYDIAWRAAYHGLTDPDLGYPAQSQLTWLQPRLRKDSNQDNYYFTEITFLDIIALEPRDDFFRGLSWFVDANWKSNPAKEGHYQFKHGWGLSYYLSEDILSYGFLDGELALLDKNNYSATALLGFSGGLKVKLTHKWYINIAGFSQTPALGQQKNKNSELNLFSTWQTSQNSAIQLISKNSYLNEQNYWQVSLQLNYYY
jgi:hypothetical protein